VFGLLVLWDVDYTLVDSGGVGRELYEQAFSEMFGRPMPQPGSMAGRTDRAIMAEVLSLAGEAEQAGLIEAFHAVIAAGAPRLADLVRQRSRVLPGAATALAALAALAANPTPDGWRARPAAAGQAAPTLADRRAQPAAAAQAAPAPSDGRARPAIVQSLLTGNIRALAEVKLAPLGLTRHLDLDAGAYGDAHENRAELVPLAWQAAARAYGHRFGGGSTVLVGDTPFDVAAALAAGARAVGVATGPFTTEDLAAAGADAVLPDLADTDRVLTAILGPHER
jgi:phosphoglycolate phosphatase-like HAD superfamily hydrolase